MNPDSALSTITGPDDFQRCFSVSRETVDKLVTYEALLKKWQRTINLVAPSTLPSIWHRHFADSAQLAACVPANANRLVDLGTGAGFPGLVLAIILADQKYAGQKRHQMFIESDGRKAAFLREAARNTGVPVDILVERIEKLTTQRKVSPFDVVTARALASLSELCALSRPLVSPGGVCLFLKGRDAGKEVEAARKDWAFDVELVPSITDADARIVQLSGLVGTTED